MRRTSLISFCKHFSYLKSSFLKMDLCGCNHSKCSSVFMKGIITWKGTMCRNQNTDSPPEMQFLEKE